jgi:hypothetical protein
LKLFFGKDELRINPDNHNSGFIDGITQ